MSLFSKFFGKSNKPSANEPINLQKIFPRIKGFLENEDAAIDNQSTSTVSLTLADSPIIQPLADGIGICYMQDNGHSYRVIANKDLSDTLTIEQLHDAALTNMAKAITDKTNVDGDPNNVMMVTNGGNFEATMLLADFLWEQLQPVFNDAICVAIPANDLLFIAGKNSAAGRESLRKMVRLYFDEQETKGLVSRNIYEKAGKEWKMIETVHSVFTDDWEGVYIFQEGYGKMAGMETGFTISMKINARAITGTCTDEDKTIDSPATITGMLTYPRIEFVKVYNSLYTIDQEGNTYNNKARPSRQVRYFGIYEPLTDSFKGSWQIAGTTNTGDWWMKRKK